MLLVGPPTSGKTSWLARLLEHLDDVHTARISRVIYCYDQYQPVYDHMRTLCPDRLEFCHGLPPELLTALDDNLQAPVDEPSTPRQTLLIMDDMMNRVDMDALAAVFFKGRHRGLNPILVLHNLTFKGGSQKRGGGNGLVTINRCCSYRVLFSIPSDVQNVRTLQTQMFPNRKGFLMAAYQDACCSRPYGYLVLDTRPTADNNARVYTQIWPGEEAEFYLPPSGGVKHLTLPGSDVVDGEHVPIDYLM